MLCNKVEDLTPFYDNDEWVVEPKIDGERALFYCDGDGARVFNRRGDEVSFRFPEFRVLKLPRCVLDGEIVCRDFHATQSRGHLSNALKIRLAAQTNPARFVVFDLLELDGSPLLSNSFAERRRKLEGLFRGLNLPPIQVIPSFAAAALKDLLDEVKTENREGLVLKRKSAGYEQARSANWIKWKNRKETVIEFTGFEETPSGIVLLGGKNRVTLNGYQSSFVKRLIKERGRVACEVEFQDYEESGLMRMPTFKRVVQNGEAI